MIGIKAGVPMAEYLDLAAFSASVAHTIDSRSPLHAWSESAMNPNRKRDDSKEADLGIYAHACLLEGGTDNVRIFDPANFPNAKGGGVATGWTNKAIRAARDEARANGEIPMLLEFHEAVKAMVAEAQSFIQHSELAGIFEDGAPEQTMIWKTDGVLCKARPDWLNENMAVLLHYKTCANAEPNGWQRRQLAGQGYDIAAVHYEIGSHELTGVDYRSIFLVQEVEPPYSCSLTGLAPAMHELVMMKWQRAFNTWKRCSASGAWPAYPSSICWAEPAAWQLGEQEERNAQAFSEEELAGGVPL